MGDAIQDAIQKAVEPIEEVLADLMSLTYSVSQFSPPPLPTYLTKNRHTIRNVAMVLIALLKSYPLTMVPPHR